MSPTESTFAEVVQHSPTLRAQARLRDRRRNILVPYLRSGRPAWLIAGYPAMVMVLRGKYGEGHKAVGDTVKSARGLPLIGKKLAFGSRVGQQIMDDNGLVAVGHKLELGDSQSVANLLNQHGPFLVAGTYDLTNLGHCVVVLGVDHASQKVCIQDPAQNNASAQWYALDYLKNTYRNPGSFNIDQNAVIALDPNL